MKKFIILILLVSSAFAQTNNPITNQVNIPSGGFPYSIGPYQSVQTCTYDGTSSNFVMIDFNYNSGFIIMTNNMVIWPQNTPSDLTLCGNYNLYVVSLVTNIYTVTFITNSVIVATNFYQPQQKQAGWQFGATMYKFRSIGSNVMVEGGNPIYYHR